MKTYEELEKENKEMYIILNRINRQMTVTFDDLINIKKLFNHGV